jgi:CubicO group peptidase (beta-lactamase class C family)
MDSAGLAQGLEYVGSAGKELHSLLVVRDGQLLSETYWPPYQRNQKHVLNSCTKAFVSALTGIASDGGLLREDDAVLKYFPEGTPRNLDDAKKAITIKHLLTMSSGISWPQSGPDNVSDQMGQSRDWVKFILDRPMAAAPGAVTNYSNGDSHLRSAIIGKVTGFPALEFAHKRLFGPLGIDDVRWDADPQGRSIGSAALYMRPVDMTKLGLLYLASGAGTGSAFSRRTGSGNLSRLTRRCRLAAAGRTTATISGCIPSASSSRHGEEPASASGCFPSSAWPSS